MAEEAVTQVPTPEPADRRSKLLAFLFTDIEGSTRLAQTLGDRYEQVLDQHREILREAFSRHGGTEVGTEGDSFFVVFSSPAQALQAASVAQAGLAAASWPAGVDLRVRMGLHVGEAQHRDGDYVGVEVHRAARVAAVAHGGQILLSQAAAAVIGDRIPDDLGLRDLGLHRLKDFDSPGRLFQVTGASLKTEFPPIRGAGKTDTNLPSAVTSFVGRGPELADLDDLLGLHRLVTLIGTGGSGKTRLMIETGSRILDRFDGAWLVELASVGHADFVVNEVGRVLGVKAEPGRPLVDMVIDFLRSKSLLMLLDNCEHVIGAVAVLVERLLASCPTLTIVCTSREALGVHGETVLQVPSLALPPPSHGTDWGGDPTNEWFEEIAATEAVQLFVDRARAVLGSFSLTPDNAPAVVEICRRLDGIPLAIELAAARVKVLSTEEIAVRLNDRFRLLTGGSRTAMPRQQTLQALIDWSWDLLAEPDKELLRRLAVFAGAWTLQAAAAITRSPDQPRAELDPDGDTLDGLGQLIDRSLVVVDRRGPTRYRLLETIRQYALDRLAISGEAPALRDRHLAYFLNLAVEAIPQLRGRGVIEWLERLDGEADNLRSALEWAFETESEAAIRLAVALNWYWRWRPAGSESLDFLARASNLARGLPPPAPDGVRERKILLSRVLSAEAFHIAVWSGGNRAIGQAEEAFALARQVDDPETWSGALGALSIGYSFAGNVDRVPELLGEVIEHLKKLEDWWTLSFVEGRFALWHWATGDPESAEQHLANGTEFANRTGNFVAIAFATLSRGRLAGFVGRLDEARQWLAQAIDAYQRLGDRTLALVARSDLAHAVRVGGDVGEAEALYRETLHDWRYLGNRGAIANQLECLGYLALAKREYDRAATLLGAAEIIREKANADRLWYEIHEYEAATSALRSAMEPVALEMAWSRGQSMTIDEATNFALRSTAA